MSRFEIFRSSGLFDMQLPEYLTITPLLLSRNAELLDRLHRLDNRVVLVVLDWTGLEKLGNSFRSEAGGNYLGGSSPGCF